MPSKRKSSSPNSRHDGASFLCVVTVTYDSGKVLPGLLDSLAAGLQGIEQFEVVVADNDSLDDSVDLAVAHPIRPRVVRTGRNGGYAAGINAATAGIPENADVLILNPDIRLRPGSAKHLIELLKDPSVGIAVPRILEQDGSVAPSLRREPSIVTAWSEAVLGGALSTRLGLGEILRQGRDDPEGGAIQWASGAAIAVSARARRAIGNWDESFFLYSEEVDYQRRVRASGLSVQYVPEAEVIHLGGDYQQRPRLYEILTANRILDFGRCHGPISTAFFRLAVIAGEAIRSAGGSKVHRAGLRAALSRWQPPFEARARQENKLSDA
jgi:GT2 family glycosyltransferase